MTKKVLFIYSAQKWYTRNEYITSILSNKYNSEFIWSDSKYYIVRIVEVLWKFLKKNKKEYDFVYIGFLAQVLVPFIKFLFRGRIVADYFISLYDTICLDRKRVDKHSFLSKLIYKYEKWALTQVDLITVDTISNKKYFAEQFRINENKIRVIYALANTKIFYPQQNRDILDEDKDFQIFFYSSCQPLHGIDVILKTAKLLSKEDVYFILIGHIKKKYQELIIELQLSNVKFIDWVEYNKLPLYISKADVCLGGHFGNTKKAKRVIAGKTFQFAAMKKSIILGDNVANKEVFSHKNNCLMVKMGDENALAKAILHLKNDRLLREKIAREAYITVMNLNKREFLK